MIEAWDWLLKVEDFRWEFQRFYLKTFKLFEF